MTAVGDTPKSPRALQTSTADAILTAQLAVAWAGEAGEAPRLKWWRTDLVSEFGGEDLFKRLMPHTWRWAVFEGAREAARRRDTELRARDADPDRLLTLFRLGFDVEEHLDERLADLKRSGKAPLEALPALNDVVIATWSKSAFGEWVAGHGDAAVLTAPAGRRLKGETPAPSVSVVVGSPASAWQCEKYPGTSNEMRSWSNMPRPYGPRWFARCCRRVRSAHTLWQPKPG